MNILIAYLIVLAIFVVLMIIMHIVQSNLGMCILCLTYIWPWQKTKDGGMLGPYHVKCTKEYKSSRKVEI